MKHASTPQPTMTALVETVAQLFPRASEVTLTSSRGTPPPGEHDFIVMPHRRSPRLLVPAAHGAVAAVAMRRYSSMLTPREAAARFGVSVALRWGLGRYLPDRICLGGSALNESIRAYLESVLGEPVLVSIGIGTARANRKPVLQVFDHQGRSVAFVKIGDSPLSVAHVKAEAAALQAVARRRLQKLSVPRVLHTEQWRGMFILILSALPTKPWDSLSGTPRFPETPAAEFANAFAMGSAQLGTMAWWARMRNVSGGLRDLRARAVFMEAIGTIAERYGDMVVPVTAWHGDWTPWNMCHADGQLQLWDFERFETGVPAGLDRFHFAVNASTRAEGLSGVSVKQGLARAGWDPAVSDSVESFAAMNYMVAITARYLQSADYDPDDYITTRALVMLGVLRDMLGLSKTVESER